MNFKDIAEEYLIAGLNPLPLRENKAPNLPKGHKLLYEENTDLERFNYKETKKIGVACGSVSGNLYCIDFDGKGGLPIKDVFIKYTDTDQFRYLVKKRKVCVQKTMSGGYHIIFRTEEIQPTTIFSKWDNGDVMIEARGQGAYIAIYPSEGYSFIKGAEITELQTPLSMEELDFLIVRAKLMCQSNEEVKNKTLNKTDDNIRKWPDEWPNNTPDGYYNNHCQDEVIPMLEDLGWTVSYIDEKDGITYLTRPEKDVKDGISATYGYKKGMLSVFSSSAIPFKEDFIHKEQRHINYTPFAVLTYCKFKKDWRAAKDYLRERFGMPDEPSIKPEARIKYKRPRVTNAMDFPIDIFEDYWQQYILACEKTLNYAPEYTACAMISTFSSVIGNSVKLKVKSGWNTPCIFWFGIVGSPGTTKSHPVSMVLSPLMDINKKNYDAYDIAYREWEALSPDDKRKTRMPIQKQVLINDTTVEAVAQILSFNENGALVYRDELIGFFKSMNQYRKGADEEFWLTSFTNGSRVINRKTQKTIYLKDIFLNVIGTIQDAVLMELSKDFKENGFLDRFLFTKSIHNVRPISDESLDSSFIEWWDFYIKDIYNDLEKYKGEGNGITCSWSDAGWKEFVLADAELIKYFEAENIDEGVKNSIGKLRTYLPRFALLFCMMDLYCNGTLLEVTEVHVQKAKRITDYFFSNNQTIYSGQTTTGDVVTWLNSNKMLTIKEKAKYLLEEFDLKQVEVAAYLKTNKSYISKILKDAK